MFHFSSNSGVASTRRKQVDNSKDEHGMKDLILGVIPLVTDNYTCDVRGANLTHTGPRGQADPESFHGEGCTTQMRLTTLCIIAMILCACLPAHADEVRIGLFQITPPHRITLYGPCDISMPNSAIHLQTGKALVIRHVASGFQVGLDAGSRPQYIKIRPPSANGMVSLFNDDAAEIPRFRGWVELRSHNGAILVINHVDIQDYLRAVLPGEMPSGWPRQAYEAQAVVARSYTRANMGRHAKDGFDLCSLTHCQVYRGSGWGEHFETDRAVQATSGMVLAYHGKLIPAPYHSTCGGRTTDSLYVNDIKEPYLSPVSDMRKGMPFCAGSPHSRWKGVTSAENLAEALRSDGIEAPRSTTDLKVTGRDASGRVISVRLTGDGSRVISGYALLMAVGRHIGWWKMKSAMYTTRRSGTKIVFEGKGLGHGMGLCQWGAKGMADKGFTSQDILKHYFPKCQLMHYAAPGNGR